MCRPPHIVLLKLQNKSRATHFTDLSLVSPSVARRRVRMREPDLIVIGGGSAGAACAARLAQGGKRVLLVEAGKSDNDIRSKVPALMSGIVHTPEFDWMYTAEPDASVGGRADVWPAGKRLGGGSAI